MIRVLIRLMAVLATAPIVVLTAGTSHACSCVMAETAEQAEWADRIFTGEVVEVLSEQRGTDGVRASMGQGHEFVVAVDEVYKGEATAEVTLVTASNSAACGIDTLPGPGDKWVWFAQVAEGREDTWGVNICGGSGPVGDDEAALADALGTPTAAPQAADPDSTETSGEVAGTEADPTAEPETARMVMALGGITVLALGAAAGWRLTKRRD